MAESWKDKTVSLGNVDKEVFDSDLAHITVSENGISVEFRDVEDWKRIKREIGEETILKEVPWEAVEDAETNVEHLYYPHIDVETEEGTKRLYFHEDEAELLHTCFSAINEFRTAYRESGARPRDSYSYEGAEEDEGAETADEQEEAELTVEDDTEEESDGLDEEEKDEVEEVVEDFMDR